MHIKKNPDFYNEAIRNCERNIEYVKHSNFSPKEKRDLEEAYKLQILHYKKRLLSFYQPVEL